MIDKEIIFYLFNPLSSPGDGAYIITFPYFGSGDPAQGGLKGLINKDELKEIRNIDLSEINTTEKDYINQKDKFDQYINNLNILIDNSISNTVNNDNIKNMKNKNEKENEQEKNKKSKNLLN